jgi:hypothetical protein
MLLAGVCLCLYGLGRAPGSPTWWPTNPLFLWEVPLQASGLFADDGGWVIHAYKWVVALCIVGLFPIVPMIVGAWAARRETASRILKAFKRSKSDPTMAHSKSKTPVPRRPKRESTYEGLRGIIRLRVLHGVIRICLILCLVFAR